MSFDTIMSNIRRFYAEKKLNEIVKSLDAFDPSIYRVTIATIVTKNGDNDRKTLNDILYLLEKAGVSDIPPMLDDDVEFFCKLIKDYRLSPNTMNPMNWF